MLGRWLVVDHPEFLTDAREREDAVRPSSWPYHHQLERSGTRSLIRSKERPQTRRIKEGEASQVEYDPTGRGSFEDAAERIFDAGDGRQVEFAQRAQEDSAALLLDGKLKTICQCHDQAQLSRAPRERRPRAEGAKRTPGSRCTRTLLRRARSLSPYPSNSPQTRTKAIAAITDAVDLGVDRCGGHAIPRGGILGGRCRRRTSRSCANSGTRTRVGTLIASLPSVTRTSCWSP